MIQDVLAASAFGLAACAFGALIHMLRRSAPTQNQTDSTAPNMDSPTKKLESLQDELQALSSHIRVSEGLRLSLQAKLEANSEIVTHLNLSLENQKKSFLFKENSWLKDKAELDAKISTKDHEILNLAEKIRLFEIQIHTLETTLTKNSRLPQGLQPLKKVVLAKPLACSPSHLSPDVQLKLGEDQKCDLPQATVSHSESSPKLTKTINLERPTSLNQKDSASKNQSLRAQQLNLMLKTLQGKMAMLEERNQNWEVALRYLSEDVLRHYGRKSSSIEIGPLVATALEAINKSLIMNDMFQSNHDDMEDLSVLSELLYERKEPAMGADTKEGITA